MPEARRFQESRMPGNPLVRFDEGRVGRTQVSPSLLLYRSSAALWFFLAFRGSGLRQSQPAVILQNAAVHHHREARFRGAPRGVFVDYAFLHPDHLRALANRRFHDLWHEFRAAENIHDIDGFGDGIQIRVTGLTQHLLLQRIHWNDAVARALHVLGHAITVAEALSRQADHGDGAGVAEDLRNLVHTALDSLERWMARFSFSTSSSVR